MEMAIATLLSLLVMAYIGYPFYRSRRATMSFELNHRAEELEMSKSEIYAAIKDIEFDYQMGKLSEEDFNELKQQYSSNAINLLKEIDMIEHSKSKRQRKGHGKSKINFCSQCGASASRKDAFCANCGAKIA